MTSHRQHELLPMGERSDAIPPTAAGGLDYEEEDGEEEGFDLELEAERLGEVRHGGLNNPDQLREQEPEPEVVLYSDKRRGGDGEQSCCTKRLLLISLAVLAFTIVFVALVAHFAGQLHSDDGSGGTGTRSYVRILASSHDARSYRFLQLDSNSLGVLLISDANCTAASGAMSVGTGSGSDPPQREGLAHYLEHALFLGSTQYPDAHAYAAFLAAHGGSDNAYTSEEETNFFFEIQSEPGNLAGVLPLFSGFFTSPLLAASTVLQELNAVDSEHRKNILNDDWRGYRMLQVSASPSSRLNHFGTGTRQTLNHSSILQDLRDFHTAHYTADNMQLVLLGKETLPELEALARKWFSKVPGPKLVRPSSSSLAAAALAANTSTVAAGEGYIIPASARPLNAPFDPSLVRPFVPFDPASISRNVSWVPVNDPSHKLSVYFALNSSVVAPLSSRFRSNAAAYVAYMLGHEGSAATMCSRLKSRSLVQTVQVGLATESKLVDEALLAIDITLTNKGNDWDRRTEVLQTIFEYIALLAAAPLEVHEAQFANMQAESGLRFEFAQKARPISYTSSLASRMNVLLNFGLPVQQVLLPPLETFTFSAGEVARTLGDLSPKNCIIVWSSSDLQSTTVRDAIAPAAEWVVDQYYGIVYHSAQLSVEFLASAPSAAATTMQLPPLSNPFMPSSFAVQDLGSLIAAAAAEKAASGSPTPAQDALSAVVGPWDPLQPDLPVSLPLLRSDGSVRPATPANTLLFKPDAGLFGLPYGYFSTLLRFRPGFLSDAVAGPGRLVALQVYLGLLEDVLSAARYELGLLGATFTVETHPANLGIVVNLFGFADNLPNIWTSMIPLLFLDTTATSTTASTITPERFETIKQNLLSGLYESFATSKQPYEHAMYFERLFEERSRASMDVLGSALAHGSNTNSVSDIASFMQGALGTLALTSYAYGNLNISSARSMHSALEGALASRGVGTELTASDLQALTDLEARELFQVGPPSTELTGGFRFKHRVLNPEEANSALVYTLQICTSAPDDEDVRESLLLMLVAQLLSESAFNVLRTRWALGYMVWAILRDSPGGMGPDGFLRSFMFVLQHPSYTPLELEAKVEEFLAEVFPGEVLDPLDETTQLPQLKSTLLFSINQKQKAATSMADNFAAIWTRIIRGVDVTNEDRINKQRTILATINKEQLLQFYQNKFVSPSTRRKLVMSVYGAPHDPLASESISGASNATLAILALDRDLSTIEQRDATRTALKWGTW